MEWQITNERAQALWVSSKRCLRLCRRREALTDQKLWPAPVQRWLGSGHCAYAKAGQRPTTPDGNRVFERFVKQPACRNAQRSRSQRPLRSSSVIWVQGLRLGNGMSFRDVVAHGPAAVQSGYGAFHRRREPRVGRITAVFRQNSCFLHAWQAWRDLATGRENDASRLAMAARLRAHTNSAFPKANRREMGPGQTSAREGNHLPMPSSSPR